MKNEKEGAFPWSLAKLVAKYTAIPCEVVLCNWFSLGGELELQTSLFCFDVTITVGHNKNVVALRRGRRECDG